MRFIHTADWHLGRLFHGVHLTEDQAHVLDQLVDLIRATKPHALVVSGDVYDRAVPPADAVELLDDTLCRIVLDLRTPVLLIAGNHDSAPRLEFGSSVLAEQGLHMAGCMSREWSPVIVQDDTGPVHFYTVPFAEPALVRETLSCESIRDHDEAWHAVIEQISRYRAPSDRSVIIAHAFVTGAKESESERPLSVGGADRVDAAHFAGFQYAALGHLHRPQSAGADHIRYAGSLLKYSFSEVDHVKGVTVVEMDARGRCSVESVSLTPRRDVRRITGYFRDILEGPQSGESREDYLMVTLQDKGPIMDVMGRLREVYPNTLHIERIGLTGGQGPARIETDHRKLDDSDLFNAFFSQVTGDEPSQEEIAAYHSVVDAMRQQERETATK